MAIVKMKKLRAVAMASDRGELFDGLWKLGAVEISDQGARLSDPEWSKLLHEEKVPQAAATRAAVHSVKNALDALAKYGTAKNGLFVKRFEVTKEDFLSDRKAEEAAGVCTKIAGHLDAISRLSNERTRLLGRKSSLLPWKDLELAVDDCGTENVSYRLGVCPAATDVAALAASLDETDIAAQITELSADKQQKYLLLTALKEDEPKALEFLHTAVFSVVSFPGEKGFPKDIIREIDEKLDENSRNTAQEEAAIAALSDQRDLLRMYSDRLGAQESIEEGTGRVLTDGTVCFFEGWCPAESLGEVRKLLDRYGCAWEAEDPAAEDIPFVPVKLKNNRVTDALNMVTEMYSLPSYANVDPNPLMAFFFILFYGIMMADMGYGLLMFLAGVIISKKYAPKGTGGHLFNLMIWCGISTFIMGMLTGGFFGDFIPQLLRLVNPASTFELPAVITPLNDTIMILAGCMGLGFVHMLTGMVISVYIKAKRGEYMSILWNEVTWWVVFAGIAAMLLAGTKVVLYIGLAMVAVGAGWDKKGIGQKLLAILVSLYNNVTGYFGDILSYSRLMALMLAGSVIAQVFNTLGTIPGNVPAFILISMVGNTLNFGLNLLGCYVHDLRLQCLEFFNKFYEDGGKPFRPMEINPKYVDIQ